MKTTLIVWISAFVGYIAGVIIGFALVGPAINTEFEIANGIVKFLVSATVSFFLIGPAEATITGWVIIGAIIVPLFLKLKK